MGKDRFAKHTRRFAHLPLGSCLYAAELSNGVVKIGCTSNGRARMMSLASDVARQFKGAVLVRFHVVKRPTEIGGRRAEVRAINLLNQIGQPLPGRQEFFQGVRFKLAVRILDAICQGEREPVVKKAIPVAA